MKSRRIKTRKALLLLFLFGFCFFGSLSIVSATTTRYCSYFSDPISDYELGVSQAQNLAVEYDMGEGPCIITGMSYIYRSIDGGPTHSLHYMVKGDSTGAYVDYLDSNIPYASTASLYSCSFVGPVYVIDDDPRVEFSGTTYSAEILMSSDNSVYGHSYDWNIEDNWQLIYSELIAELSYEWVVPITANSLQTGSITEYDYVDAYNVTLSGGTTYGFVLNRTAGSGNLNMRLVLDQELTNYDLAESSGSSYPEVLTYTPSVTNSHILLIEANTPVTDITNYTLILDTIAPALTEVSSPKADGTYSIGDEIPVTIVFSEPMTVTGTPQLTLETGTTDAVVDFTSGDGTTNLTFNYGVAAGHTSADLDYVGTSSLALNGGTIKDLAGNVADLTLPAPGTAGSLGANKNLVIEGFGPTITSVSSTKTDGTYGSGETIDIMVTFSNAVTVTGTPRLTLETGTTDAVVDYTTGSGSATLTFTYTVAAGHASVDLDYAGTTALALNGGTIKNSTGNNAILTLSTPGTAGSLGANKNLEIDAVGPTITSVNSMEMDGTYGIGETIEINVTFSETVTVTGTPRFTLETGTSDAIVDYTTGSGSATLTFTYTVAAGHVSADLDYTGTTSLALNGGTIQDVVENDAVLTLPAPGTAGSLGANKDLVIDAVGPTVISVSSTTVDGTYKTGHTIAITMTFNEAVTVTGTPRLTLETGTADVIVDYASGSGSTTLIFSYTVAAGHTSPDLEYAGTNALALNGGTIQDAIGNDAVLVLPAPGAPGSLSVNKNLIIDTTSSTTDPGDTIIPGYDLGNLLWCIGLTIFTMGLVIHRKFRKNSGLN